MMGRSVRQLAGGMRPRTSTVASRRLGGLVMLAIGAVGAQGAEGQQRLLVLPFVISAPEDSAISHELAAILREQLAVALLGEIHVVDESQMAEAFQAARIARDAILPPITAWQLAQFSR